ncbi:MAG: hypothetical protein HYV34_00320, partial [Candidatus Kerfeldbacteria bacterium]|nr:hypothetical protein [Candidatus Kerfeldbacteria bacterium]
VRTVNPGVCSPLVATASCAAYEPDADNVLHHELFQEDVWPRLSTYALEDSERVCVRLIDGSVGTVERGRAYCIGVSAMVSDPTWVDTKGLRSIVDITDQPAATRLLVPYARMGTTGRTRRIAEESHVIRVRMVGDNPVMEPPTWDDVEAGARLCPFAEEDWDYSIHRQTLHQHRGMFDDVMMKMGFATDDEFVLVLPGHVYDFTVQLSAAHGTVMNPYFADVVDLTPEGGDTSL